MAIFVKGYVRQMPIYACQGLLNARKLYIEQNSSESAFETVPIGELSRPVSKGCGPVCFLGGGEIGPLGGLWGGVRRSRVRRWRVGGDRNPRSGGPTGARLSRSLTLG